MLNDRAFKRTQLGAASLPPAGPLNSVRWASAMRVSFTPKAMAAAQGVIAALRDPSAGLMIFRAVAGADVTRSLGGEVVWNKKAQVMWQTCCISFAEWPIEELEYTQFGGIRVALLAVPSNKPITFRISVKHGQLHAAAAA